MTKKMRMFGIGVAAISVIAAAYFGYSFDSNKTSETKYGRYIITEPKAATTAPDNLDAQPQDMLRTMTYLDDEVIRGAYYTECSWLLKAYPDRVWVKEHEHDFDEVFGFYGSDTNDPKNLNGEIELWIGGERHLLTKSCLVFVPKGTKHCPLILRRIDKPIFMFTSGPSSMYED